MANLRGFYSDQTITALTGLYQSFSWNFAALTIVITNDDTSGTNQVSVSYDGANQHAVLKAGESLVLDSADKQGVSLKFNNGAPAYRLMVEGHA